MNDTRRLVHNLRLVENGRGSRELAAMLGISPATYCRRRKNPESFTIRELKRLCDSVKVDIADFLGSKLVIGG